jgi:hypothetical protein
MALLAESLVEEWLNRLGFFTVRGVKHGVGEMDLLAVKSEGSVIIGRHTEVQVSFRPVGYISKISREMVGQVGKGRNSAIQRTDEQVAMFAKAWVEEKFHAAAKVSLREKLWPRVQWSYHLVHGVVRDKRELEIFTGAGVVCHPFHRVLSDLTGGTGHSFSASAGGDIAEIVKYYQEHGTGEGIR